MGMVEWALIAIHSMLWGSAFFFGAVAIKEIPPLTITAFRLIPACLVVLAVVLLAGHRVPWNADYWRRMFALGALNNFIPLMLICGRNTRSPAESRRCSTPPLRCSRW